jgi:hypothetical protein
VLLLSAAAGAEAHVAALGAVGLLAKPFDLDDLLATVRRYAAPAARPAASPRAPAVPDLPPSPLGCAPTGGPRVRVGAPASHVRLGPPDRGLARGVH